jgi:fructose-1,6-bisphosphatase/inositol monophosphatase family enzyme
MKILNDLEIGLKNIGDMIRAWSQDNDPSRKILEPNYFKTEADIKASNLIKELISNLDQNRKIISEEDSKFSLNRPNSYWLIDPIDGTASWHGGFDGYVTQIAYIENNKPIYGAVYAPVLNKFWTALKGNGAYLNGKKLPILKQKDRINLVDNYPEPRKIAKVINNNIKVSEYIECGSLGLKSCLVADGVADLFVKDIVIRDWDLAPAEVILKEVGAIVKDFNGNDLQYTGDFEKNNGLIVARDKNLLELVIGIVNNKRG